MNPIDAMLTKWVAPVLKDAGFARRGRLYAKARPNGDHSSVTFSLHNMRPWPLIDVELGMDLRTSRQFTPAGSDHLPQLRAGDQQGWFWRWTPLPPPQFAKDPQVTTQTWWMFEPPGDDLGAVMRELLLSEYLPMLARFEDLDWLEAQLRRERWDWPGYVANSLSGAALAMVIADRRDDPEIDALAARVTARYPDHELGPWLATRMLRGDMTGRPEAGLPAPRGRRG